MYNGFYREGPDKQGENPLNYCMMTLDEFIKPTSKESSNAHEGTTTITTSNGYPVGYSCVQEDVVTVNGVEISVPSGMRIEISGNKVSFSFKSQLTFSNPYTSFLPSDYPSSVLKYPASTYTNTLP